MSSDVRGGAGDQLCVADPLASPRLRSLSPGSLRCAHGGAIGSAPPNLDGDEEVVIVLVLVDPHTAGLRRATSHRTPISATTIVLPSSSSSFPPPFFFASFLLLRGQELVEFLEALVARELLRKGAEDHVLEDEAATVGHASAGVADNKLQDVQAVLEALHMCAPEDAVQRVPHQRVRCPARPADKGRRRQACPPSQKLLDHGLERTEGLGEGESQRRVVAEVRGSTRDERGAAVHGESDQRPGARLGDEPDEERETATIQDGEESSERPPMCRSEALRDDRFHGGRVDALQELDEGDVVADSESLDRGVQRARRRPTTRIHAANATASEKIVVVVGPGPRGSRGDRRGAEWRGRIAALRAATSHTSPDLAGSPTPLPARNLVRESAQRRFGHTMSSRLGSRLLDVVNPWHVVDAAKRPWSLIDAAADRWLGTEGVAHFWLDRLVSSVKGKTPLYPHGFYPDGWGDTSVPAVFFRDMQAVVQRTRSGEGVTTLPDIQVSGAQ